MRRPVQGLQPQPEARQLQAASLARAPASYGYEGDHEGATEPEGEPPTAGPGQMRRKHHLTVYSKSVNFELEGATNVLCGPSPVALKLLEVSG